MEPVEFGFEDLDKQEFKVEPQGSARSARKERVSFEEEEKKTNLSTPSDELAQEYNYNIHKYESLPSKEDIVRRMSKY